MSEQTLREFEQALKEKCPAFEVKFKDQDPMQKVLGKLVGLFNPQYMTRYITTLGHKVYFPNEADYRARPWGSIEVLAHEFVHMWDFDQKGFLFSLSYVFPQMLLLPLLASYVALGCFFSFFGWPLLVLGAALACLVPWPAPWRTHWEMRGYTMSLAVEYWLNGRISPDSRKRIKDQFVSMAYYRMSWSSASIESQLDEACKRLWIGDLEKEEPYKFVHKFLSDRGLVSGPRL